MNAKRIIYDAMHEAGYRSYHRLLRDKERGKVAAQILATWLTSVQDEVVTETDYSIEHLLPDVVEAMGRHGDPRWGRANQAPTSTTQLPNLWG